ncbi:hypothetical protein GLOIN_2v1783166 [Rhizophagus clarus]|uniref:Uncharacterized protein n=1 Tax=Rhizophagus clarus TaxID=94130 RepID=A0A8H3LJT1_9GLOM|nr:hypothetical protein GLOIN_2v1783166 [Rhizophagus clarus]
MVDCCCCCIPVRLGTIILAVISLVISISGATAYLGKPDVVLLGFPHGVATLFGFLFILMGLISIFGIIGSFFSSPGAVKLFEWMLWGFVIAFAVMAGVTIYSSIKNQQLAIDNCVADYQQDANKTFGDINNSNADKVVISDVTNATTSAINDKISGSFPDICRERVKVKIWITVIASILLTLFGAYFAGVVSRFADEIKPRVKRNIPTTHISNLPDSKSNPTSKV